MLIRREDDNTYTDERTKRKERITIPIEELTGILQINLYGSINSKNCNVLRTYRRSEGNRVITFEASFMMTILELMLLVIHMIKRRRTPQRITPPQARPFHIAAGRFQ